MKSLKKLYVMLALLSYAPTAILGSSYEQRIKDFYPVDNSDRADIPNIVKQEIYKLNGLQEGFRLIGENFEKFVDTNITELMPAEDDANIDAIELLDALNQKIENQIIRKIAPLVAAKIYRAMKTGKDINLKDPVIKYVGDYTNSFTGQIFKNKTEPSGKITISPMNKKWSDLYDRTFFVQACRKNNPSACKFLINNGVGGMNDKDNYYGDTPLHRATGFDANKVIQMLIDNEANVHAINISGETPLHYAAKLNHNTIAKILIDNGADVNAGSFYGNTPLHKAVIHNSDKVIQILLDNGVDVNAVNNAGDTPLHCAAFYNADKAIQLLLDNGAYVNAVNNLGRTLLDYASSPKVENLLRARQQGSNSRSCVIS